MLQKAFGAGFSTRRSLESLAYRAFGGAGLGVAAAGLWTARKYHAASKPTILVIGNVLFDKDIAEIDREGRLNWITLHRLSKILEKRILPDEIRVQRHYYASLSDPKYAGCWREAEKFGMGLLRTLRLRGPVDAVFSSHVDYWQDEGIRRACARLGIPFLSLCHENYNVPRTYRIRSEEFCNLNFRFGGAAVATFSNHMRDMFVRAAICSPEKIVVTGAPRFDGWQRAINRPDRQIVLLSFLNPQKYYASGDFFFAVLDALCALVEAQPEWKLTVKCKGIRDTLAVRKRVGSRARVLVGHDMPLPETLSRASAVIGGNSLSMVEALLSGAALFVPVGDGDAQDPDTLMFNPSDPLVAACFNFVHAIDDLKRRVGQVIDQGAPATDREDRLSLVRRYVHYTEGGSSGSRVADFIEQNLNPARSAARAAMPASVSSPQPSPLSHHNPSVRL